MYINYLAILLNNSFLCFYDVHLNYLYDSYYDVTFANKINNHNNCFSIYEKTFL